MPLTEGYGVLIGQPHSYHIDPPDLEGRWPHFHLYIKNSSGVYDCAINLKSRTDIKIQYRDFRSIKHQYFEKIFSKPDGFHQLEPIPESGALDFIRHPGLQDSCTAWYKENGENLVTLMKYYLIASINPTNPLDLNRIKRIYIFGEPFAVGTRQGMHNIHMNQGDPVDSGFSGENGIWQDGGVIYEYNNTEPLASILLTKFQTQSLKTDNSGRPLEEN